MRRRRPSLWRRAETVVLAAVLIGVGVTITLKVAPSSPPAAIRSGPQRAEHERGLVFDRTMIDLGPQGDQAELRAEFRFRNRSDTEVRIGDLRASCGCLEPQTDREVYAPGEAGVLVLGVQTAQQSPGQHEYYVDMTYHAARSEHVRLTLRVDLSPAVVVRPPALFAYLSSSSPSATEQVIEVIDGREFPLTVLGTVPSSPYFTAEVLPVRYEDSGAVVYPIRLTLQPGIPAGRHDLSLSIATTDPEYGEITVPVVLMVN